MDKGFHHPGILSESSSLLLPPSEEERFFTARDRTNIFLQVVALSEYGDVVTTIQTSVDTYRYPDNNVHLPDQ
jgi:hypothetical protein